MIAIGCDHAGVEMKNTIIAELTARDMNSRIWAVTETCLPCNCSGCM